MVSKYSKAATIGTLNCAIPTCADDMANAAPSAEGEDQQCLDLISYRLNKDRIKINNAKTVILRYKNNSKSSPAPEDTTLRLNGSTIEAVKEGTHLGILIGVNRDLNSRRVDECIALATRTMYALFGAGLHGRNGLSLPAVRKIWKSFIAPRLLYGSELWQLDNKHIHRLEIFQRGKLRQLQNLPARCANSAVYFMIGILSVEAQIDLRIFTLLRNSLENRSGMEYNIALRQMAIKDSTSSSWFVYANKRLEKYGLPSVHDLLISCPPRMEWKRKIHDSVEEFCVNSYKESVTSSLRFCSDRTLTAGKIAPAWESCGNSARESSKARAKIKALAGCLRLATHEVKFGFTTDPSCRLCRGEPEDRLHFVLNCPQLSETRKPHIERLESLLWDCNLHHILHNQDHLLQFLLDANHKDLDIDAKVLRYYGDEFEQISRDVIFSLHAERLKRLNIPKVTKRTSKRCRAEKSKR